VLGVRSLPPPPPAQIHRARRDAYLSSKKTDEEARLENVPIYRDPVRMQPILATLNQIEQEAKNMLNEERMKRHTKIARVRTVMDSVRFLTNAGNRRRNVMEMTKQRKKRDKTTTSP
jgi:hypothetical protein